MKTGYLDIEATHWTHFEVADIYIPGEGHKRFDSVRALVIYIARHPLKLYAHNGGGYDFKFIAPEACEQGTFRAAIPISGKFFKMWIGKSVLIDSMFLLKEGLASLGSTFGMEKGEMDYTTISKGNKTWKYLKRDCEVLAHVHKAVRAGLETEKDTIGSCAVDLWRRSGGKLPSKVNSGLGRRFYFGGRVEIFDLSARRVSAYDVNSLYPMIMTEPLPSGPYQYRRAGMITDQTAGACCDVDVPDYYHAPPIPYYHDGKLWFPSGKFQAMLAGPEARLADSLGLIKKVRYQITSDYSPICREFVEKYWELRKAATASGDAAKAKMYKWLLNNLSGKFAEQEEKESIVRVDKIKRGDVMLSPEYGLKYKVENRPVPHSVPAISAHITSAGRVHLWHLIQQAGERTVTYCSTDCVHTSNPMPTGPELGELKLERTGSALYLQTGIYRHAGHAKVRGYNTLPGTKADQDKKARFNRIFRRLEKKGEVELHLLDGAIEVLVSGKFGSSHVIKRLLQTYDKRCILSDGITTRAWSVEEIINGKTRQKRKSGGDASRSKRGSKRGSGGGGNGKGRGCAGAGKRRASPGSEGRSRWGRNRNRK